MKRRVLGRLLVVLLLAVGAFALKALYDAGAFKTIQPHFAGKATVVPGTAAAQEMAALLADWNSGRLRFA